MSKEIDIQLVALPQALPTSGLELVYWLEDGRLGNRLDLPFTTSPLNHWILGVSKVQITVVTDYPLGAEFWSYETLGGDKKLVAHAIMILNPKLSTWNVPGFPEYFYIQHEYKWGDSSESKIPWAAIGIGAGTLVTVALVAVASSKKSSKEAGRAVSRR